MRWRDIKNTDIDYFQDELNRKLRYHFSNIEIAQLILTLTGTANQITITDDGKGNFVFSLPQNVKIGDIANGHYSEFESDGTYKALGNATTWDDLNGSALALQQVGPGVSRNATENTVDFTTAANLSDYMFDNFQIRHRWKAGSVIQPHIHWFQAQNKIPNFLIRYRWQVNGGTKTTSWTDYKCATPVFTYTTGTLHQICHGAGITPPANYNISDVIEFKVFRDNANTSTVFTGADPYTATVGISFIDIHIEEDTLGSRSEYSK